MCVKGQNQSQVQLVIFFSTSSSLGLFSLGYLLSLCFSPCFPFFLCLHFLSLKYLGRNLEGQREWAEDLSEPRCFAACLPLPSKTWVPERFNDRAQEGPSRLRVAKRHALQVWKSLSTSDILSWQIGLSDLAAVERVTWKKKRERDNLDDFKDIWSLFPEMYDSSLSQSTLDPNISHVQKHKIPEEKSVSVANPTYRKCCQLERPRSYWGNCTKAHVLPSSLYWILLFTWFPPSTLSPLSDHLCYLFSVMSCPPSSTFLSPFSSFPPLSLQTSIQSSLFLDFLPPVKTTQGQDATEWLMARILHLVALSHQWSSWSFRFSS